MKIFRGFGLSGEMEQFVVVDLSKIVPLLLQGHESSKFFGIKIVWIVYRAVYLSVFVWILNKVAKLASGSCLCTILMSCTVLKWQREFLSNHDFQLPCIAIWFNKRTLFQAAEKGPPVEKSC